MLGNELRKPGNVHSPVGVDILEIDEKDGIPHTFLATWVLKGHPDPLKTKRWEKEAERLQRWRWATQISYIAGAIISWTSFMMWWGVSSPFLQFFCPFIVICIGLGVNSCYSAYYQTNGPTDDEKKSANEFARALEETALILDLTYSAMSEADPPTREKRAKAALQELADEARAVENRPRLHGDAKARFHRVYLTLDRLGLARRPRTDFLLETSGGKKEEGTPDDTKAVDPDPTSGAGDAETGTTGTESGAAEEGKPEDA